jgi:transcriptional regulator with XRE-family HTH domain
MSADQLKGKDEQWRHEFGEVLKKIREDRGLTQKDVTRLLKLRSIETYANFERGKRWPPRKILLKLRDTLHIHADEWTRIQVAYFPERSASGYMLDCWVLDETRDRVERSPCLSYFYNNDQVPPYVPRIHGKVFVFEGREFTRSAENFFRPTFRPPAPGLIPEPEEEDAYKFQVNIYTSAEPRREIKVVLTEDGYLKEEDPPNFYRDATRILENWIKRFGIILDNAWSPKENHLPAYAKSDVALIGGPGKNCVSDAVNREFQKGTWFRGFYFESNDDTPTRWAIRHHLRPEVHLTSVECCLTQEGKEEAYRRLKDGWFQDYGLVYIGPNPLNTNKYGWRWLIMVAGLGPIGTLGAAKALLNPRIFDFFVMDLGYMNWYYSGVIRYRCGTSTQEIREGHISSIFLTRDSLLTNR